MTLNSHALVSIVIPCHNAAAWIGETVDSIRAQSGVTTEIVLVDDGSDDNSAAIAREHSTCPITVITQSNLGASRARNVGTAASRGQFIQYLDADDLFARENVLHSRVKALVDTGCDVAYGDWIRWEQQHDGSFAEGFGMRRRLSDRPDVDLFTDAWWPPGALLYRRTLIDRILPWREDLPVIQDARFLLDAALAGGSFVHVDGIGLKYRVHGSASLSRRDPSAFLEDVYRNAKDIDAIWQRTTPEDDARKRALVKVYAFLARSFFSVDRDRFETILERLYQLDPQFLPEKPRSLRAVASLVGYPRAEHVAASWRLFKRTVGLKLDQSHSS